MLLALCRTVQQALATIGSRYSHVIQRFRTVGIPGHFAFVSMSTCDIDTSLVDLDTSLVDIDTSLVDIDTSLVDIDTSLVDIDTSLVDFCTSSGLL